MNLIQLLDGIGVEFGDVSKMRKENNSIIHNNEPRWVLGFVGGKLDNSVHRMFGLYSFIIDKCISIPYVYIYIRHFSWRCIETAFT